jgi:ribosomal protein L7Ae-like RNA K-turn-binding protein
MNPITNAAVAAVNQLSLDQAVAKASSLVAAIADKQQAIAGANGRIEAHVKGLNELQADILDASKLGIVIADNLNGQTVAKTIETLNKAKQDAVKLAAERLGLSIDGERKTIALLEAQVADLQKALADIQPEVVTPEQIVG